MVARTAAGAVQRKRATSFAMVCTEKTYERVSQHKKEKWYAKGPKRLDCMLGRKIQVRTL